MGQEFVVLTWVEGHQRPRVAAGCPLPAHHLPSQASLRLVTSKQALGHFLCPFIALNGEGLPAWALKGQRQEGYRPSGKHTCVGVVRVGE